MKFSIAITATGFTQATDYYVVDLYCGKNKLTAHSDGVGDTPGVQIVENDGTYYLLVETALLRPGSLRMVVTAYVPDEDFPGEDGHEGTRREVAVQDIAEIGSVR